MIITTFFPPGVDCIYTYTADEHATPLRIIIIATHIVIPSLLRTITTVWRKKWGKPSKGHQQTRCGGR